MTSKQSNNKELSNKKKSKIGKNNKMELDKRRKKLEKTLSQKKRNGQKSCLHHIEPEKLSMLSV